MLIAHDLPDGTAEDVIDMIAKAMLIRMGALTYAGQYVATITWDDLRRASDLECEIVKHPDGVTIRSKGLPRN